MLTRILVVSTLLLGACARTTDSEPQPTAAQSDNTFYALLNLSQTSYIPLEASKLANESEVIATGTLVGVADGLTIKSKSAQVPTALSSIVVALEVSDGIKGTSSGERVYVQFIHGGAVPTARYAASLPKERVTLFLSEAVWMPHDEVEYLNVGAGHPEGTKVYRTRTPQGMLIVRDERLVQPLESGESLQLFSSDMTSLDDIADWYASGASPIIVRSSADTAASAPNESP